MCERTFVGEDEVIKMNAELAARRDFTAYSAKSAHPFRKNGAPFRLKLSSAQLVN